MTFSNTCASTGELIAFSSERREGMRSQIGSAHYSYIFVEEAFVSLLDATGYNTAYVTEPEMFKTRLAYQSLLLRNPEDVIHLAFRSAENLRPMYGARNICHYAWEFEVLRDFGLTTDSILDNQTHMLGLMDEIWVSCRFTQSVLRQYGLKKTYIVPVPIVGETKPFRLGFDVCLDQIATIPAIPLTYVGALSQEQNAAMVARRLCALGDVEPIVRRKDGGSGRIFLSVLSPGDLRKNLLNMIDGFEMAAGPGASEDLLVVKLAVPNKGDFRGVGLFDALSTLCRGQMAKASENIVFILDYLSHEQMNALFCLADFYIAASHCEGLNLPLLQAMSFGTVPLSTVNTAMEDYIDPSNAVVIKGKHMTSPIEDMAGDVALRPFAIDFSTRFDIARAVGTALRLAPDRRRAMSETASDTVLRHYGAKAVSSAIAGRVTSWAAKAA